MIKKENILNLFLLVVIGTSLVVGTVSAATTISENIVTGGTLSAATTTLSGFVGIATSTQLSNEKLNVRGDLILLPGNQGYLGNFGGDDGGGTNFYIGTNLKDAGGTPTPVISTAPTWYTVYWASGLSNNNWAYRVGYIPTGGTWGNSRYYFSVNKFGKVELGASTGNPDSIVDTLQIASSTNATTTVRIGNGGNKGSCLALYDSAGTAIYAYVAAGQTAFTLSTTACR